MSITSNKLKSSSTSLIPVEEQTLFAKALTVSNLAMEHLIQDYKGDVSRAYEKCADLIEMETGESIGPEFRDWIAIAKRGTDKDLEQWNETKESWLKRGITLY
jgi:hypothetical protein